MRRWPSIFRYTTSGMILAGFFIRGCICRLPTIATRLRLTTALAVRLHRAFAGRPFLKPIAICLQCQGKILANTAIPNPKGGRNGNVRQGQTRPHKEFAVAEFIPKEISKNNCYYFAGRGCTV